jgi:hypothetical protein
MKKNLLIIESVVLLILIVIGYTWYRSFQTKDENINPSAQVTVNNSATTITGNPVGAPSPGYCLILQEEYCKSGKLIYSQALGSDAIAFKVPEETPVFASYNGKFAVMDTRENETANRYPLYLVYKNGGYDEIFNAVFTPSLKSQTENIATKLNSTNVSQGALIGYVSGEKINLKDYPKENYNLVISLTKKGVQRPDEWNLDPAMKKLFNL